MDIFGMYGSRSDDEPVKELDPPADITEEPPPEAPEPDPVEDTVPMARITSARADAERAYVESMDSLEYDGQIVRPYARTGGRTRTVAGLELETLLALTSQEIPYQLPPDHRAVAELCRGPVSVVEVASYRNLPIGAARVIISDLIEYGLVSTSGPKIAGAPPMDLMQRVLQGLQNL